MKNICNPIHFTLYKVRIAFGDDAWNKVSDNVRFTVRLKSSEQVSEQVSNKVKQNVKL
jgi:hypothetical protein